MIGWITVLYSSLLSVKKLYVSTLCHVTAVPLIRVGREYLFTLLILAWPGLINFFGQLK